MVAGVPAAVAQGWAAEDTGDNLEQTQGDREEGGEGGKDSRVQCPALALGGLPPAQLAPCCPCALGLVLSALDGPLIYARSWGQEL